MVSCQGQPTKTLQCSWDAPEDWTPATYNLQRMSDGKWKDLEGEFVDHNKFHFKVTPPDTVVVRCAGVDSSGTIWGYSEPSDPFIVKGEPPTD